MGESWILAPKAFETSSCLGATDAIGNILRRGWPPRLRDRTRMRSNCSKAFPVQRVTCEGQEWGKEARNISFLWIPPGTRDFCLS